MGKTTIKSTSEFIVEAKNKHGDTYLYDKVEYIDSKTKVLIGCKVEGHGYFEQSPNSHLNGKGCSLCVGKSVGYANCLSTIRPDLVKYFEDKNIPNTVTVGSSKRFQLRCPDCGMLKNKKVTINALSTYGFSCDYCSDGKSIPEKFGIYLFKQLGVEFETQKVFDWAKDKKYDKYFILNDTEFCCEVNGSQHYKETNRGRSLKEEQENDQLKYDLAIRNGIKPENYIIINGSYSDFNWLKDNYILSLNNIFDLSNIDWMMVWENSQSSMVIKVCEAWNNKKYNETVADIQKNLGISRPTIVKYLKIGNEIGKCDYDPKEEIRKNSSKNGKVLGRREWTVNNTKKIRKNNRKVYQYTMDGNFIQEIESCEYARKQLKISHVHCCCNGRRSHAGGFKWSYEKLETLRKE